MDDVVDSVTVDLKADIDSAAVMSTAAVDLSLNAGLNAAVDSGNDTALQARKLLQSRTLLSTGMQLLTEILLSIRPPTRRLPSPLGAAVGSDLIVGSDTSVDSKAMVDMEDDVKLVTVDLETAADSDAIGSDTVADSHTVIDPTPAVDSNAIADVDTAVDSGAPAV